jgi:hypothetical protein
MGQNLEYGKVSKQELLEKRHPLDTSAVAAILYKKAITQFYYAEDGSFGSETNYEIRLKIYKKEGLSYGNYSIKYYVGWNSSNEDNVFFSDVVTYNLENDKIVKSKLTSDGTIKESFNDYWVIKKITLPNVKVGSVIEFKYKLISENVGKLPNFNFQELLPVNYAEYRTETPVNYQYKTILRGYSTVEQESVIKPSSMPNNSFYKGYLSYTSNNQKYTLNDIPALKEEPYIDNIENHRIKIENELSAIFSPDSPPVKFSETWSDVAMYISDNQRFKDEIQSEGYFENNLKLFLNDSLNQTSKTKIILNYVKNRIKWNGNMGYFPTKGVVNAYNNRTGNVAAINMNLIIMLRSVGITAHPVLLSTRENGKYVYPNQEGFNYLIAKAKIDDKVVLLDATDLHSTFNILPIRCLNDYGRLISSDGKTEEVFLNPVDLSKSTSYVQADLDAEGTLTGKIRNIKSDYFAFLYRDNYKYLSKDLYLEKLESDYNNSTLKDYKQENFEELDQPIIESFSFSNSKVSDLTGNKIILNPFDVLIKTNNPFKAESRTMPIDFIFPKEEKFFITISIPDGYVLEYLPKSTSVSMLNNDIVLNFKIASENNKITINSVFTINKTTFDPVFYQDLKNIFKLYVEKQSEFIILKKRS